MNRTRGWMIGGLAAAMLLLAGCGKKESMAVEEECAPCLGGSCKLPASVAQGKTMESPARLSQTAQKNPAAGEALVQTVYRKLPAPGKQAEAPVVARVRPAQNAEQISAMQGGEGHFNDVKLPGVAHEDKPENQPFLVRTFSKKVWPAGVPTEAEIDPAIMNF